MLVYSYCGYENELHIVWILEREIKNGIIENGVMCD